MEDVGAGIADAGDVDFMAGIEHGDEGGPHSVEGAIAAGFFQHASIGFGEGRWEKLGIGATHSPNVFTNRFGGKLRRTFTGLGSAHTVSDEK